MAVDLAVLFLRTRYWIGDWPDTGAAALVPAYLLGVVGAGAAAWAAGAPARHGMTEQLTPSRVHPMAADAHRLGATLVVLLIPYLIGQLVAFAVTARTFPPGVWLWFGYATLGVFVILLATALGWTCGKLLGPVFAALLASLGFLFFTTFLGRMTKFYVITGPPEEMVDPLPLALRFCTIAVLISAILWLNTHRISNKQTLTLIPALIPLLIVMVATSPVTDRPLPGDNVICVKGKTTLCLWPEHEKYLPVIKEISARVDALPDAFQIPPLINEFGIEKTEYIAPDGVSWSIESAAPTFKILEGSPWSYAGEIATAVNTTRLNYQDCDLANSTPSDDARMSAVYAWLEAYLVGGGNPDYHNNAPQDMKDAFAKGHKIANSASLEEQFRWAAGEVSDLSARYCHPKN
jgi:hypothetical protein